MKEAILKRIEEYSSILITFSNEYKQDFNSDKILSFVTFLQEIKFDIEKSNISDSLYDRIFNLIKIEDVEKLGCQQKAHPNNHNFEEYRTLVENIFLGIYGVEIFYKIFKDIGFITSNIVLIGANGCGKTIFANNIREYLEMTEKGIVIPAQNLLIFPNLANVPMYKTAYEDYQKHQKEALDDKITYNASKNDDFPYDISKQYSRELNVLVSLLVSERIFKRSQFCSNVEDGEQVNRNAFRSLLDEIIEIWNNLIEHRTLFCDDTGKLQIKYNDKEYSAYMMSDGERKIFYVVGRVLLSPQSSLIIVDEPEMHLHKAILNKLWTVLEERRKDCTFIYLTHDVEFASTRNAMKYWMKSYKQGLLRIGEWEIEPLPKSEIPEELLMKLLGSRKKILFCEGKKDSLDKQIYEILFPNFTITPLGSCKDVINYTKAFNRISNKYAEAYGIIDCDFRTQEELEECLAAKIYPLGVAEIENLFLLEDFIKGFTKYKKEKYVIDKIKKDILDLLNQNKEQQVSYYVTKKIEYYFKNSHIKNGHDANEVTQNFRDFVSKIDITEWYNQRMQEIDDIIATGDYYKAIMLYNNKGLHKVVKDALNYKEYHRKALEYLKSEEDARIIMRNVFPQELIKIATQN